MVWAGCTDIEKSVSGLAGKNLGDNAFHGDVLADVTGREIGWNHGCRLGLGGNRTRATNKSG